MHLRLFLALVLGVRGALGASWDYVLPQDWQLSFPACGGRQQSPVDIVKSSAVTTSQNVNLFDGMSFSDLSSLEVSNTGHGLQVSGAFTSIEVVGETYNALQFHLHFPSEHAINGKLAEGELHIVHQKAGSSGYDDLLVIGVMIEKGVESPLLKQMGLPTGAPATADVKRAMAGTVNLKDHFETQLKGSFFHYDGSLTTPPCTESVKWFVLDTPTTASVAQIDAFKTMYTDPSNARPPQLLGGRKVVKDSFLGCPMEMGRRLASSSAHWNYVVPQCWATEYPACGGSSQSPINIDTSAITGTAGSATIDSVASYVNGSNLTVTNSGHGLTVSAADGTAGVLGKVVVDGSNYEVLQFHLHFPSEHILDGMQQMGELHIVHQKAGSTGTNDLLVVGVFIEEATDMNTLLSKMDIDGSAPQTEDDAAMSIAGSMNLGNELGSALAGSFYHYSGSLTTPPCSETVKWFVLDRKITATKAQAAAFSALQGTADPANARPVQKRNGRALVKGKLTVAGESTTNFDDCDAYAASSGRLLSSESQPSWDYMLPQCWAKHYPACGGRVQSPVNILSSGPFQHVGSVDLSEAATYSDASDKKIKNTGHGLQVDAQIDGDTSSSDLGYLTVAGSRYNVLQFHIHCPSEHTIDGKVYDCEMHVVHQKKGATGLNDLLVGGIMYTASSSSDNTFLKKLGLPSGAPASKDAAQYSVGTVNLQTEFGTLMSQGFYRYDGSLTTPPCTESVSWFVLANGKTMSTGQLEAFKAISGHSHPANNRPVQLLNGRGIFKNTLPGCYVEKGKRRLSGASPGWGYVLPQCWVNDYHDCGGERQSPINIDTEATGDKGDLGLSLDHKSVTGLNLKNTGHGLQVDYSAGGVTYKGDTYNTLQFHFHWPSEHAIDGHLFPAEMHIVHQKDGSDGLSDLLVVGIMYDVGEENAFLKNLGLDGASSLPATTGESIAISGSVAPDDELSSIAASGFYNYDGSLTTPPCSQTVTWIVMAGKRFMSVAQLERAKAMYNDPQNNRPLQKLNGRTVGYNAAGGYGGDESVALGASWDYVLPQDWQLSFPACGGRQQSPVDIVKSSAVTTSQNVNLFDGMSFSDLSSLEVSNTGHGLQVSGAFTSIEVVGETYNALQFHLHFPSEHAINGKLAEGELHIVHQKAGSSGYDDLLVIGVMIEKGAESPLLKQMGLPTGAPATADVKRAMAGTVNVKDHFETQLKGSFFHYDGSLTTPPCTESVKWFVLDTPTTASVAQIDAFKTMYTDPSNARPPQLLGGRKVVKDSFLGCPMEMGRRLASSSAHWNYVVPQCWATEYPACGGSSQSPINIDTSAITGTAGSATIDSVASYVNGSNLTVTNSGHGLTVSAADGTAGVLGKVVVDGSNYEVLQFHLHFPSEHILDGMQQMGELHIVHQKAGSTGTNDLLVVGVFIEEATDMNTLLSKMDIDGSAPQTEDDAAMSIAGSMNLGNELGSALAGSFYHYSGSLTTPPCSETVKWFVLDRKITATKAQAAAFSALQGTADPANARPVQKRNGRALVKGKLTVAGESTTNFDDCDAYAASSGRLLSSESQPSWDYMLPQCWAKHYPACGGRVQSPVNILSSGPFQHVGSVDLSEAATYSDASDKKIKNTGHGLQVDAQIDGDTSSSDLGYITLEGSKYNVLQFHIHCPSEHTIDGKVYDCEMHVVHQKEGATGLNDLLVGGIMYTASSSSDNTFLKKLGLPSGAPASKDAAQYSVGTVNLQTEFGTLMSQGFYRYDGSLTTPPCTESVSWFVLANGKTMSTGQLEAFKAISGHSNPANNRPVQLLNGRGIFKNTLPGCYVEKGKRRLSGASPGWGYVLPQCWANDYPDCGGERQSPINIDTEATGDKGDLELGLDHKSLTGLNLKNTGHGLQVDHSAGGVTYKGDTYNTLQFHFHWPSEHAIDGHLFPAEMHIVHQKDGSDGLNDLLVVGIMYDVGEENAFLKNLGLDGASSLPATTGESIAISGSVAPDDELSSIAASGFYNYAGSLTTPPCSQTVTWIVMAGKRFMSVAQLERAKAMYNEPQNNRPLQKLNGRTVGYNAAGGSGGDESVDSAFRASLLPSVIAIFGVWLLQ